MRQQEYEKSLQIYALLEKHKAIKMEFALVYGLDLATWDAETVKAYQAQLDQINSIDPRTYAPKFDLDALLADGWEWVPVGPSFILIPPINDPRRGWTANWIQVAPQRYAPHWAWKDQQCTT